MEKQTAVQQLLSLFPDAAEIKAFISENDADEKMLDQWLWERIYKGKDWEAIEKQQIVEFGKLCADKWGMTTVPESTIETLFKSTYKTKEVK